MAYLRCVKGYWYICEGKKQRRLLSLGKVTKEEAHIELQKWKTPPMPKGEYDVIYADPPWRYDFVIGKERAIEEHYSTMRLREICSLKVPSAKDSILFLWAPSPILEEALKVLKSWGFLYRSSFVWVKDRIGMGYYSRLRHEFLLVGRKGHFRVPGASVRYESVIHASYNGHSKKPDLVYDIIESAYPPAEYRLLELFARQKREGWTSWGNDVGPMKRIDDENIPIEKERELSEIFLNGFGGGKNQILCPVLHFPISSCV